MGNANVDIAAMFTYYKTSTPSIEEVKDDLDNIVYLLARFASNDRYTFDMETFSYTVIDDKLTGKDPKKRINTAVSTLFNYVPDDEVIFRITHKNYVVFTRVSKLDGPEVNSQVIIVAINTKSPSLIAHSFRIKHNQDHKVKLLRSSGSPYRLSVSGYNDNGYNAFISHDYLTSMAADAIQWYVRDYRTRSMHLHIDDEDRSPIEDLFIKIAFDMLMGEDIQIPDDDVHSPTERADAIFTMPKWPKKGHYRSTPSGKKIWIGPTTCYRNQRLLTKE